MKKILISLSVGLALLASTVLPASAATLTTSQVQAVISLLQAFGVASSTITSVEQTLTGAQTNTATASTATFHSSMIGFLRLGDTGDGVKLLQITLAVDPSIYPEGVISGTFGPLTQKALKRYQKKHRLEQMGFVGPKTLRKLDDDLKENPIATEDDDNNASSTIRIGGKRGHICAIVPPGHLIAPGWLRHNDDERPEIPPCQKLPRGIEEHEDRSDDDDDDDEATTTPPILDTTAPIISAISVGSVASTSVSVAWTTNEPSTSKVRFGTSTPLDLATAATVTGSGLLTAHALTLSPLTASTTYYYVIESRDASNNAATTSQNSFTTLSI